MRGKQRKHMLDERYKVKYGAVADRLGKQNVLLPCSFGASSLVLYDMVASLLREQNLAHKGKQGFDLVVVHLAADDDPAYALKLSELSQRYAPVAIKSKVIKLDEYIVDPLMKVAVSPAFQVLGQPNEEEVTIAQLLAQCTSRSLREDLLSVVKEELFRRVAVEELCQTILYGHSLTRLANEVIALTVKGRGLNIHEAITNRTLTYRDQELQVIFPLRDILLAEIMAVLNLTEGLPGIATKEEAGSKLAKYMTVQELTTQYFDNLDATGYASTASTVVKTAEKLGAPKVAVTSTCQICGNAIHKDSSGWLRRITVNTAAALVTDEERDYATAYEMEGAKHAAGEALNACYGCTVTLAGAGDLFLWPVRATKQEILDEYVLGDE